MPQIASENCPLAWLWKTDHGKVNKIQSWWLEAIWTWCFNYKSWWWWSISCLTTRSNNETLEEGLGDFKECSCCNNVDKLLIKHDCIDTSFPTSIIRTQQNDNEQNKTKTVTIFKILSFEKSISELCYFVQTTVDHFLFRSAAVFPDYLCTNISQKSQIY